MRARQLPQEYLRSIGFLTRLVLIFACGLTRVLGFCEALSMLFRSLLYPFLVFCRFLHDNIPPKRLLIKSHLRRSASSLVIQRTESTPHC